MKSGPLSEDEWEIMRRHPEAGEAILAPITSLREVLPVVRSSHERWDGSGYPDGLSGEDIPLVARIVCCCDAFNAMTTDRPYRKARPLGEALAELRRCSGTHFDPTVVEAIIAVSGAEVVEPRRAAA